jgi:hypothetical protein
MITLRKWIKNFINGMYDGPDVQTQIDAGWFDWFCSDEKLARNTQKIGNVLKDIDDDYILDNFSVSFDNGYPYTELLYDSICFKKLHNGLVEDSSEEHFVVTIDDKRESSKYCIWTRRKGEVEYRCKTKRDLLYAITDLAASFQGQKWENLGDVNFLAYGGSLVRPHWSKEELKKYPDLDSEYDVFNLITEAGDNGDKLSARLFCVDIDDVICDADNKKEILTLIGLEDKVDLPSEQIMSPENWAMEMVEDGIMTSDPTTFKTQYPGSWEDTYISMKNLKSWLKSLGAGQFI